MESIFDSIVHAEDHSPELFTTDRHLTWEKEYWSERIVQVLELALEGVKREKIPSFFIPTQSTNRE